MKLRDAISDALAMQRSAARDGFDWRRLRDLWPKLSEEIDELRAARNDAERAEELGDLMFMLVNLARHLDVDPARALRGANRKFKRRYAWIERHFDRLPPKGDRRRLDAMEALWRQAKQKERSKR